jgi:hypothetical protein
MGDRQSPREGVTPSDEIPTKTSATDDVPEETPTGGSTLGGAAAAAAGGGAGALIGGAIGGPPGAVVGGAIGAAGGAIAGDAFEADDEGASDAMGLAGATGGPGSGTPVKPPPDRG